MPQVAETEGAIGTPNTPAHRNRSSNEIAIQPKGPFSWSQAVDVLGHFPPASHQARGASHVVRLTFPLDREYTPVAVALRDDGGVLRGDVAGTTRLAAVTAQVARIFSLDYDGSGYPAVGERDPHIGRLMAARPGLRPVCFTSPYETAAWAIISQRISMHQAAGIKERLLAEHGHPVQVAGEQVRCFPMPERLLTMTSIPGLNAQKVERYPPRSKGIGRAEGRGS